MITDSPSRNKSKKKNDKNRNEIKKSDKGKKRILYVSSSESEQEAPRQCKIKKPCQYPELDDKDLHIIDHSQRHTRRNWQDDGESISSKETPPSRRYRLDAPDENGNLEGFVVPDEVIESGDDEELLPLSVRRQRGKERQKRAKALREFEARRKEAEERKLRTPKRVEEKTPRLRTEPSPLPKMGQRVEKSLGRGLGGRETRGTVSVPAKKALKEIIGPKKTKTKKVATETTGKFNLVAGLSPLLTLTSSPNSTRCRR